MRKLMWFAIGFTVASALGIYLSYGVWLLLAVLFCLPSAIVMGLGSSKWRKRSAFALWGCFVCFLWLYGYDSIYLTPARNLDGVKQKLCVEITDYSYDLGYGTATEGKIKIEDKVYRLRVYLDGKQSLAPGNLVEGTFQLQYTAAGGEKKVTYHQGEGIFLLAYDQEEPAVTFREPGRLQYLGARLRHRITAPIDEIFPEDVIGFARALLLGDSSLLTYEEDTAFRISGLRHIIAVSGLHVSILFSLVYLLVGKHRGMTALIGIPVLLLFAAAAGFTPSITRACIMQTLMILAMLLNREYDPPTALSFAVVTMLLINPQTITSVSFQLSVACMVGIFLFSQRIYDYLLDEKRLGKAKGKTLRARLSRWICGSASVTLGAMVTTTPLCAWYFGCVSLVGILSNLLTLWVVSFVFYGIIFACVAGFVWIPVGKAIAWCVGWPIRYVLFAAKSLSAVPLAAVYVGDVYIVSWLIFSYVLLAVFYFCKDKRPILLGCCILVSLGFSLCASYLEARVDPFRVTMLNVGQGQCVLLQNRDSCYLVDCGGDSPEAAADTAAEYLLSQGITHLNGIIVTHYDIDHVSGIPLLLTRITTDRLYLPDVEETDTLREKFAVEYSSLICWIEPESTFPIPDGNITVFAAEADKSDNESSLCILFQPENYDILITGDRTFSGEQALMDQTELPDLEILIAGHHGAATSTGYELLWQTKPETVLISAGADNPFGHPAQETLQRLALFGCTVLRTDIDGTIIIGA